MAEFTHKQLVDKAAAWLRNRCSVVVKERACSNISEVPDAIGFKASYSILIECKTSRADFIADKKKFFRRHSWDGMGNERYFLAPKGMLNAEDLPEYWGLLEAHERQVRVKVKATPFPETSKKNEVSFLVSVLRRLEIAATVFVRQEE